VNERQWWSSHVRPRLLSQDEPRTAIKVQNTSNPGLFDSICCFDGVVCAIETKFLQQWPARPDTTVRGVELSPEQERHLDEWDRAHGISLVLLGVYATKEWFLFQHHKYTLCLTQQHYRTYSVFNGQGWPSMSTIPGFCVENFFGRWWEPSLGQLLGDEE